MYVRGAQTFIHPSTKRKRHFLDPMFSKPSVMAMYIRLRVGAGTKPELVQEVQIIVYL